MAKGKKRSGDGATKAQQVSPDFENWQCVLILALLVVVFFHQHLIGKAFLWEDFLYHSYPVRSFAATSMAMGELPLWNPFTFNGMPFLADIQTTVFYLPCTALMFFVQDGVLNSYWLQLLIILHYLLAGVGMFYLAKSFRLLQLASLVAGVTYMFSGFMITHAIHQQIITLVSWYPLILLFFRNAITTKEWKWVFLASLVLGHSTFAGYPQLSLYFYCFLGAFFLLELFGNFRLKELASRPALTMTAKAGLIVVLSVAVAMIQLLPTLEISGLSQRAEITYEKSAEGSLAWSQLLTFYFPKLFGVADAHGYSYFGPGPYWFYWETSMYLGILPLFLGILSFKMITTNRMIPFLWGVIAFVLLFSLGRNFPLHKLFFEFVPGFSTFRNPARMGILLSLAISLLSAFSLDHLLSGEVNPAQRKRFTKILMILGGVGVGLWVLISVNALQSGLGIVVKDQMGAFIQKYSNVSLFVILATSALLLWFLKREAVSIAGSLLLVAAFFGDAYLFGGEQNTASVNPMEYFGKAGQLVEYFKKDAGDDPFRVNSRNSQGMIMDRNQGMVSRLQTMEGYTPLALQRVYPPMASDTAMFDLLNVRFKTVTNGNSLSIERNENPVPRAFFVYRVHVTRSEEELLESLKSRSFDYRSTAVLEKDPGKILPPPASRPQWSTKVVGYQNNAITLQVETSAEGFMVLSEIFYPGWNAYVDGTPTEIFRTDYNLRGFFVREGVHEVQVRFEPASFANGRMITLASVILCVGGIGFSMRRKPEQAAAE
ncbi:MAG: hypothetical protein OEM41_01465 [Ignavibacteria bacterium]|nr:hypothetical protein [Ignavibacteria bacterium]